MKGYTYNWPYDFFSLIETVQLQSSLKVKPGPLSEPAALGGLAAQGSEPSEEYEEVSSIENFDTNMADSGHFGAMAAGTNTGKPTTGGSNSSGKFNPPPPKTP